jgi:hypothetical protein
MNGKSHCMYRCQLEACLISVQCSYDNEDEIMSCDAPLDCYVVLFDYSEEKKIYKNVRNRA